MENVVKFTNKFIESVNVAESLLNLKPSTANGALYRINAIKHLKENAITFRWMVGLVQEGVNIQDASVEVFVSDLKNSIVENQNAVTLGYLSEGIMESENPIYKNVQEAINKVINEGESKIGASVLGGELSNFKSHFADLKAIENRVVAENINNKNMVETNQLAIYSPMSYVMEQNGSEIVRIGNHIFALNEHIVPTHLPNKKFLQLSEACRNIQYNIEESRGEISTALGKLVVEGSEIKRDVDGELQVVETEQLIKEFASGVELRKFEQSEITKLDNVIAVAENHENYRVLESFKVIENKQTNEVALIAEHNGSVYGGILESQRTFKSFKVYSNISEAVNFVKNTIGVDASKVFESQLEAEKNLVEAKNNMVSDVEAEITTLETKRKQVQESLSTTTEGGEAHTKLLNLDIQIGEALIALTKKKQAIVEGTFVAESVNESEDEKDDEKDVDEAQEQKRFKVEQKGLETLYLQDKDEDSLKGWLKKFKKNYDKPTITELEKGSKEYNECVDEAQKEGDDEAYTKFFQEKLKKYKVESPEDLDEETRKKFFQEIEDEWKSDDEGSKVESDDNDDSDDDDKDVDESDDDDDSNDDDSNDDDSNDDDSNDDDDDKDVDESDDDDDSNDDDSNDDDSNDDDDDKDVDESDDDDDSNDDDSNDDDDDKDVDESDDDDDSNDDDEDDIDEGKEPDSKFEIGDKVFYLPIITGMNRKKPLVIENKRWYKEESLFGEKTEYMWWYSFKGSNLVAREKELTSNVKDVKESVDVAFDELTK